MRRKEGGGGEKEERKEKKENHSKKSMSYMPHYIEIVPLILHIFLFGLLFQLRSGEDGKGR